MTNSKYIPKTISASILLVAATATPLLISSCGGLSKSDRETIEVPPVTVGAARSEPANTTAAAAAPVVLEKPAAKKKPAPAVPPYSLSNAVKYVVEPGDSLSVISAKHGASMGDVMKVNKIKNANRIRIGQTLLLPAKAAESAEVVATEAAPPSSGNTTPVTTEDASSGTNTSALKLPSLSGE